MRRLILAALLVTACDPGLSDPGSEVDDIQDIQLAASDPRECVTICDAKLGGCHQICSSLHPPPDDPIEVAQDTTCSRLRPIDVCGDGCCDQDEVIFGPAVCMRDCRVERIEWRLEEGRTLGFRDGKPLGELVEGRVRLPRAQ